MHRAVQGSGIAQLYATIHEIVPYGLVGTSSLSDFPLQSSSMCEVRGKEFVRTLGTGLFLREVDREFSGVEGTICRIFPYRYPP